MTRLLCLTSWYPPHHRGGYETSCFDVMTRLEARGHPVEVLCADERLPGVADPDGPHEQQVHRRLHLYHRDDEVWAPSIRRRLAIERHNHQALRDALDSARPDVVSVWHVGAMSLGLVGELIARRIPVVYGISDLWPTYCVRLDAWVRLFARSPTAGRLAARVTGVPCTVPDLDAWGGAAFISRQTRDQCRQGSRWAFPRAGIVYSGVDGALFRPRLDAGGRPWRGRVVYVGRLDPRKGLDTLLRAMVLLPECTLTVDGRGNDEDRGRLARVVTELGLGNRVVFQSSVRAALPAVYAAADVCVFPSEWQEPFGLVPLEAMACGTPVVATGVGGSGEFLVDGLNCLRFEPGDPAALAAAVGRLAADDQLRSTLVESGSTTARSFDSDRLADAFEGWHAAAAAGFPTGPPPDRVPPH